MKLVDLNYLIEGLGVVFPDWKSACKEMEPYAEEIWKRGRISNDLSKFPILDWEKEGSDIGLFALKGVDNEDGSLQVVRKRGRGKTMEDGPSKRARSGEE